MNTRILLLSAAVIAGPLSCAPDYEDVPVKLVGVGYDPDEIGPSPTPYGGVVEYSWVNFAGGGLSLALMGLGSFDEVGPDMSTFAPPYAAVYGFSYIFSTKLAAADSLGGVTSVPPETDDTCYTTFAAGGPIGSFNTVDIGSWMEFRTTSAEQDGGMRFERTPRDYPADKQDLFIYYLGFDYWAQQASYGLVVTPETGNNPGRADSALLGTRNFPFEEEVEFRFPGAVAPADAPIASLPRPSSSVPAGNTKYVLPRAPGGVQMEWDGPRYDATGEEVADGPQQTCLSFAALEGAAAPENAEECANADHPESNELEGQIYTGPWDASDGKVTFRWSAGTSTSEVVSVAVRFLGKVDRADPSFLRRVVPDGRRTRDATPCEDEGQWVFDPLYETNDGELIPALRGDPFDNVAEVTCRLKDDGEYTLDVSQLQDALEYARRNEAEGAIFYFARSTEAEATVPPAKDQYNQRLDITPVKLTSRAVDIGRFWFEE